MSTTASAETPVLAGALGYLKREWSIIPVGHDKRPLVNWKPYQERRPTVTQVRDWFDDDPEAGIAIITGAISGIVVLDVDAKSDGRESLEQLQNEHGRLPQTVTVKTGGGGRHFYFQHPAVISAQALGSWAGVSTSGVTAHMSSLHPRRIRAGSGTSGSATRTRRSSPRCPSGC
jgi:Bifunctional DNA primase/polymerase, N-terminal